MQVIIDYGQRLKSQSRRIQVTLQVKDKESGVEWNHRVTYLSKISTNYDYHPKINKFWEKVLYADMIYHTLAMLTIVGSLSDE